MEQSFITGIIKKYLSARFPVDTEERVQKWLVKEKDQKEKEKASFDYWNGLEVGADSKTYAALERVNRRTGYKKKFFVLKTPYRKIARVAAVFIPLMLLIGGGIGYYFLSDNKEIAISAAYGEQKRLILPDNSEIWLNAGSTVTYPESFADNKRVVRLEGEAYFSVKKETARPFIVETPQLSVKVLGTKFNVKAYPDEDRVTTTLTSGKVEVTAPSQPARILQPNERLTYDKKTASVFVATIDTAETEGWIKGNLIFVNATAGEIFRTLERRYAITMRCTMPIPLSKRYTVKFLKNESPEEILDVLKDIIGFDYRKHENKIVLTLK